MNEENEFDFKLWLNDEIKKHGWSLYELEANSGVSEQSLSAYLNDQCKPTLRSFMNLLKAFNQHIVIEND